LSVDQTLIELLSTGIEHTRGEAFLILLGRRDALLDALGFQLKIKTKKHRTCSPP